MTSKTFSPLRLTRIRRMRMARRLYKTTPVFALIEMQRLYPGYSLNDLWSDLHRRTKAKTRDHKSSLARYGRYGKMMHLVTQFALTGNPVLGIQAERLGKYMTRPYRIRVVLQRENLEFTFPATVALHRIAELTRTLKTCSEISQVLALVEAFRAAHCNID